MKIWKVSVFAVVILFACEKEEWGGMKIKPSLKSSGLKGNKAVLELGQSLTIKLEVNSGSEELSFAWIREADTIAKTSSITYEAKKEGQDVLHCTAWNSLDTIRQTYTLTVVNKMFSSNKDTVRLLVRDTVKLTIDPSSIEVSEGDTYSWMYGGKELSKGLYCNFYSEDSGYHTIQFIVQNNDRRVVKEFVARVDYSPYIRWVFDYKYGVGQHQELATVAKAENFRGEGNDYVLLGGWGGYIVGGFDHAVMNKEGYDFGVYAQRGYGNEPGVVFVMEDANGNGKPDDVWYELKGSEFEAEGYIQHYELTYYKPNQEDRTAKRLRWKDNQNGEGELKAEHGEGSHSWWWHNYGDATEVVFSGTKLPTAYSLSEKGIIGSTKGRYEWGYAENYDGTDYDSDRALNQFDISNAIDDKGGAVTLKQIHFVKVQTGVFYVAGLFNEISTEVRGAVDLQLIP